MVLTFLVLGRWLKILFLVRYHHESFPITTSGLSQAVPLIQDTDQIDLFHTWKSKRLHPFWDSSPFPASNPLGGNIGQSQASSLSHTWPTYGTSKVLICFNPNELLEKIPP